jgi:SAM-dependent methyltransferase
MLTRRSSLKTALQADATDEIIFADLPARQLLILLITDAYIMTITTFNSFIAAQRLSPTWGKFVEDFSYAPDAIETVGKLLQSAHTHRYHSVIGQNSVFDEYAGIMAMSTMRAEDQCTEQWYYDIFNHFLTHFGQTRHVVEVGCFTGGSTRWLYVASRLFNFTLDIVDANADNLAYARERLIDAFGEIGAGVRFYHGDLCSYVDQVARHEMRAGTSIHHDGPHTFHECLQDFASLYFIRETLLHLIIQDTNLRSTKIDLYSFVDMAAYAVFGVNHPSRPIGKSLKVDAPVWSAQIYFEDTEPEGKIIPMRDMLFRYPHPSVTAEDYFAQLLPAQ